MKWVAIFFIVLGMMGTCHKVEQLAGDVSYLQARLNTICKDNTSGTYRC